MGNKKKIQIEENEVRRLYLDEGMTFKQIADVIGVSAGTIVNFARNHGIRKPSLDADRIRNLYIDKNLSISEVAMLCGASNHQVQYFCKQNGIKKDADSIQECIKRINIDKYGVECSLQNDVVKEKAKKKSIEKYGTEYPSQGIEFRDRVAKTNIEKYGCKCPLQNDLVKKKAKETMLSRYGVENPMQNESVRSKAKMTFTEKYGVENPMQSDYIKQKSRHTSLEKYGVDHPMKNDFVKNNLKESMLRKYGVESSRLIHIAKETLNVVGSRDKLFEYIITNKIKTTSELSEKLQISQSAIIKRLHLFGLYDIIDHNESSPEQEVRDFIKSLGIESRRDRQVLDGREIDIYCPDYRIGVEFDGIYWHSSIHKDIDYHYKKSVDAEERGVHLIHIYEDEWIDIRTQQIIKSIIKASFCKNDCIIDGNECVIKEMRSEEFKEFIALNSLYRCCDSNVMLGLFYYDEPVQVMGFDRVSECNWKISYNCQTVDSSVINGSSILFEYFKNEYRPKEVVSYLDFNKFNGDEYEHIGMKFVGYTGPDMRWVIGNAAIVSEEEPEKSRAQLFGAGFKKFVWKNNKNSKTP